MKNYILIFICCYSIPLYAETTAVTIGKKAGFTLGAAHACKIDTKIYEKNLAVAMEKAVINDADKVLSIVAFKEEYENTRVLQSNLKVKSCDEILRLYQLQPLSKSSWKWTE